MANENDTSRVRITTRIDSQDMAEIERLATQRRTNVSQVARTLIEDSIRALGQHAA